MAGKQVYPVTSREFAPFSLLSVTASQTAITDMSLQPVVTPFVCPEEANNLMLRIYAKHGANDPINQTSDFELYGWPKSKRQNATTKFPNQFYPTQLIADIRVTWSDALMTLNPVTQATENWAEADAYTLTTFRNVVEVGNSVDNRGKPLSIDLTGFGFFSILCNDIDPGTTINEVRVIGRYF